MCHNVVISVQLLYSCVDVLHVTISSFFLTFTPISQLREREKECLFSCSFSIRRYFVL